MSEIATIPTAEAVGVLAVDTPIYRRMCIAIAECEQADDAKAIQDKAHAIQVYAHRAKNIEAEHAAINIRLKAERRLGEFLKVEERMPREQRADLANAAQGRTSHDGMSVSPSPYAQTLDRIGLSPQDANRAQRLASIPEPEFAEALTRPEKPTTRGLIKETGHRTNYSGDPEWFTPAPYLDLARQVLGGFDLDPASHLEAQKTGQAAKFYTAEDDGLAQPWSGRVWLNPPYAAELIRAFTDRLLEEVAVGEVTEAILLTASFTESKWAQKCLRAADRVCLTAGRISFVSLTGRETSPVQGSLFFYFGPNGDRFAQVFDTVGAVR